MNNRRINLERDHINRHALAVIQSIGTFILAGFAVLVLGWVGGF